MQSRRIAEDAPSGAAASFPAPAATGPAAHARSRAAILRVVLDEVGRAASETSAAPSAISRLTAIGIDAAGFDDVVSRIEGRYGMRFHDEWLTGIETCGDLVDCIAERMCDAADPEEDSPADVHSADEVPSATGPVTAEPEAFPECRVLEERFDLLGSAGLENPFRLAHEFVRGRTARIRGRDVVSFTSFDYLGLAGHPDVVRAAKDAIDRFGCSASASRMVGGNTTLHDELDAALAGFIGAEAAVVFPCGYGTNASVLAHLFGAGDLILHDELSHNSMMQGTVASGAARRSFRHNDHDQLAGLLRDLRPRYRRVVIAIEGVYSMDGDVPDLPRFIDLKRRYDAILYVDEAHSIGTLGPGGRGICGHFGVDPAAGDLWMGTISKALGAQGGYVAGPARLVQYLGYTAPAFVFSTACPPANAAAALEAIRVIGREPWRVERLRERSDLFLKLANDAGLDTGTSRDTPVIPVILGSSARAMRVSQRLLERGINARPILHPAVRESAARVRFFLTCEHSEEQIVAAVEAVAEIAASSPLA